jgi:hypothetical protein
MAAELTSITRSNSVIGSIDESTTIAGSHTTIAGSQISIAGSHTTIAWRHTTITES